MRIVPPPARGSIPPTGYTGAPIRK